MNKLFVMKRNKTFLVLADCPITFYKFTIVVNYDNEGPYPKVHNNEFMYEDVLNLKETE